jgi:hypothetical protein
LRDRAGKRRVNAAGRANMIVAPISADVATPLSDTPPAAQWAEILARLHYIR